MKNISKKQISEINSTISSILMNFADDNLRFIGMEDSYKHINALGFALNKDYKNLYLLALPASFKIVEECTEARDASNWEDFIFETIQALDITIKSASCIYSGLVARLCAAIRNIFLSSVTPAVVQKAHLRALNRALSYGGLNEARVFLYQSFDFREKYALLADYLITTE